jgi:serine/threonine-protein kinase
VLHRDLKPANVLIDGRGRAKITDFGLAAPLTEPGAVGGTPAYLAPEQLDGRPATVQSDLFALGLVLYELFTGSRAFPAAASTELRDLYESSSPTSPAALVAGIDPAAERAILRCLETDPARRPGSAREVAAALPGGDPLQAALATGETPSPELVAVAGSVEALALGRAWALLAALVAGFALMVALAPRHHAPSMVELPHSPEVLAAKARELLVELGHEGSEYRAWGFVPENHSLVVEGELDEQELAALDELYRFWYRQADEPLLRRPRPASYRALVSPQPPEEERPGREASVVLTASGRLRRLVAPPPERGTMRQDAEAWWRPLLAAAGFDEASLRRTDHTSEREPGAQRIAWRAPDGRLVEAVAVGGVPVSFAVAAPAEEPAGEPGSGPLNPFALLQVVALVGAAFLAQRNLRRRRDDRLVARRLALAIFLVSFLIRLLSSPQMLADGFFFFLSLTLAAGAGAIVGVLYLAIEPYGRRHWPVLLVSWVRLWRGRGRDVLVGRHLLYGVVAGTLLRLLWSLYTFALDDGRKLPVSSIEHLRSDMATLASLLGILINVVSELFILVIVLVLLRALLRRTPAANAAFAIVVLLVYALPGLLEGSWSLALATGATALAFAVILFRFGILALWIARVVYVLLGMGLVPDPADWRFHATLLIGVFVLGTGTWGFWAAVGGRPFLPDEGEQAPGPGVRSPPYRAGEPPNVSGRSRRTVPQLVGVTVTPICLDTTQHVAPSSARLDSSSWRSPARTSTPSCAGSRCAPTSSAASRPSVTCGFRSG